MVASNVGNEAKIALTVAIVWNIYGSAYIEEIYVLSGSEDFGDYGLVYGRKATGENATRQKTTRLGCLGGVTVRASDLRSSGHVFDSLSGHYQATKVNSAFHPSG